MFNCIIMSLKRKKKTEKLFHIFLVWAKEKPKWLLPNIFLNLVGVLSLNEQGALWCAIQILFLVFELNN